LIPLSIGVGGGLNGGRKRQGRSFPVSLGVGHGAGLPVERKMAGIVFFSSSLGSNIGRPIVNQRSGLEHTGSHGKFTKETLGFLEINPRSIAYVRKCVFAF
jgi:hypothetical protein